MFNFFNTGLIEDVNFFMDTIGDGIFISDVNGTIIKTNQAACDILGFCDRKKVEKQNALELLSPLDKKGRPINKKNAVLFKSIKQGKRINNVMRQFIKNDGSRIWATITTTPIKKRGGKVKGAIVVVRDITEEKQQEEYQTDFAHMASHDLRTPLGNVLWATEYVMSEKPGKLNKKQTEYIQDTYKTLKDMNRIVNDLLSVSRLQNKKIKPRAKKISLEGIIKKVIADSEYYSKAQNVEIVLTSKGARQHYIKADPNHIRTIIQNIIENAIRYSFSSTKISLTVEEKNSNVLFACTNKGIGIPESQQKFIFAKFFRAKNAVDKKGDGTGLGLYITYEMIRINKGSISFKSVPNKNTTFTIKFKSV
jgi:PAS domain S-box-containing protein